MKNIKAELSQPVLDFKQIWLHNIIFILCITTVVFITVFLILHHFQKRHQKLIAEKNKHANPQKPLAGIWGWGFLEALTTPFYVAIWTVGIILCLEIVNYQYPHISFIETLRSIRSLILILILFWFMQRFINLTGALALNGREKIDITMVHILTRIGRLIAWLILILAALEAFGIPLSGVIAFGGGSALVVGIAAKDLLANFFSGWVILIDKPFKVGDWIGSPNQEIEGAVEYIGWRSTRVLTDDKKPLYIPNSTFTNISINNASRMPYRRIKQTLSLHYEDADKVTAIASEIETLLKTHPDIAQNQLIFVNLDKFSYHSLDIVIYAFTRKTAPAEFQPLQQELLLKILNIVKAHQASLPTPTTHVQLENNIKKIND